MSESPREIYLDACDKVAASLLPFGFQYRRSKRAAHCRFGDFDCRISFQSSHLNAAGHHVALWIHAIVSSPRMGLWRSQQRQVLSGGDGVAGGQIGNLARPHSWRDWNLAAPDRDRIIADAVSAVHSIALPFFQRFEHTSALCEVLTREELPGMDIRPAIEFLLCFADREAANAALHSFFRRRHDLLPAYQHYHREFLQHGLPKIARTAFACELAYMTIAFSLTPAKEPNQSLEPTRGLGP